MDTLSTKKSVSNREPKSLGPRSLLPAMISPREFREPGNFQSRPCTKSSSVLLSVSNAPEHRARAHFFSECWAFRSTLALIIVGEGRSPTLPIIDVLEGQEKETGYRKARYRTWVRGIRNRTKTRLGLPPVYKNVPHPPSILNLHRMSGTRTCFADRVKVVYH